MTRIERASIEGFKGIDNLEFEPGAINIITGRNNSGKTSLLEALNIVFRPSAIDRYGANLETVINHHHESSKVRVETGGRPRILEIEPSNPNRVPDYLLEAFQMRLSEYWESIFPTDVPEEDVIGVIETELPSLLKDNLSEQDVYELSDSILRFQLNGDEFTYVHFNESISTLYRSIEEEVTTILADRTAEKEGQKKLDRFISLNMYAAGGGVFLDEKPPELASINFIDFAQISQTLDISADDIDPVKVDDIGDFIREKELVKGLKTFDVDDLVFEDDEGEKYSVPFEFMGEGFKAAVGVLWELLDDKSGEDVVLLEEPETHMHPGYVRELVYFLIQVAREDDVQFFITTHNNDFLNDFFTENLTEEERAFLDKEFRLLQLQDGVADTMSYREAEDQLKDLQLDLRGL